MSLPRFFLDEQVISAESEETFALRLSADDAKHCAVLRLIEGEHIAIIDAQGDYFECEISGFSGKLPIVRICAKKGASQDAPYVVLAQGLAKGDRFEQVIRHATEVGVSAFVPYASNRSVVKIAPAKAQSKRDRWQSIARSAAMQSGRSMIPRIGDILDTGRLAESARHAQCVLICWEEADISLSMKDALSDIDPAACTESSPLLIVVGPEGGLDPSEVEALRAANPHARLVSLGHFVLRTETAGMLAPALALYELGKLGG